MIRIGIKMMARYDFPRNFLELIVNLFLLAGARRKSVEFQ